MHAATAATTLRSSQCFHDYCDVPAERCQVDHIEPYAAGGLTMATNGPPGCGFHNRWTVARNPRNGRAIGWTHVDQGLVRT